MKLLLHTCCAPCSGAIIETLLKEGIKPVIYYCNPNIYPFEEYEKRKNECSRYAAECGLEMVDADYCHEVWLQCVHGLEDEPERGLRCTECFRHRLLSSAQYAVSHGFDTLATTLASSRWKNLDQVNAAGRWAVEKANAGLAWISDYAPASAPEEPLPRPGRGSLPLSAGGYQTSGADTGVSVPMSPEAMPVLSDVQPVPLVWWGRNWRKGGLQERRNEIIREKGFYNQKWCGCEFSIENMV
ncbi:MAG: epoxyqueuosine reductase QueH [Bacteroidales bacterium]|nr:epoxyqueuosine reductase QueH [Bacteroidales bacterium]